MRTNLWIAAVLCLLGGLCLARADDQADVRAVIDKAIKATGGGGNLTKYTAETFKGKGKFHGLGTPLDYTGEWAMQPPGHFRVKIESEVNGMKFTMIQVVNGDKGWIKLNDSTMEMPKEQLAEAKEDLYSHTVQRLTPLKDAAFKLSPLGESKVGDHVVVGVQVSHKDHRDINLYFDKDKGLLLKVETRVKDVQEGGKESNQETVFSDFKELQGIQIPHKVAIKRDGKEYVDGETTEAKLVEKLDDSEFAQP